MAASDVWAHFLALGRRRGYAGMGSALPITYRDIEAWMNVTGSRLAPWELEAVIRLDEAWLDAQAKA